MTFQQLEDLPSEVSDKLPKHAQQLFMAAYNAASDNGMSEENATKVAWSSVKNSYTEDQAGNWISKENSQDNRETIVGTKTNTSDPIGNRENNAGTMRGG